MGGVGVGWDKMGREDKWGSMWVSQGEDTRVRARQHESTHQEEGEQDKTRPLAGQERTYQYHSKRGVAPSNTNIDSNGLRPVGASD